MKCRVCYSELELLLKYNNMPKAAQNFPNIEDLKHEKGADLQVSQCVSCGLIQLENEPVSYYKEVIRAAAFSEEMRDFRVKQFEKFVDKYSLHGKKVVEIGCGKGEFLSLMKQAGADAYGIEYSDESVDYCRKSDLKVEKLYLEGEDDKISGHPFDCFFIMNFFEHLPDPNATLKSLYNNLSDSGVGLIEVPNFDMIQKNNLFSEFINDHLFYFTKDTLTRILELNGFEIIECKEVWYDYIISATVRKRKCVDLQNFHDQQSKIKNDLKEYIKNYEKVAVYGAGHQALAVLSLADIASDIEYVVDDATFKQGKYTPATHIPIVSNEYLKSNPVDAIIVMAASYSDEVSKKIKNKLDISSSVSILREDGLEKL
jgi:2-polyprenyl-3-methyl-5-hydroxy-6-metoxy-1,4-benzoquinol methylase